MNRAWISTVALGTALTIGLPAFAAGPLAPRDGGVVHKEGGDKKKEEKIQEKDVPQVVMEGFKKKFPDATIKEIEKETYEDGSIHYEFEFKDKEGKEREAEFNDKGEFLEGHED